MIWGKVLPASPIASTNCYRWEQIANTSANANYKLKITMANCILLFPNYKWLMINDYNDNLNGDDQYTYDSMKSFF